MLYICLRQLACKQIITLMKKAGYLLAASFGLLLLTQSCRKCDRFDRPPITTTQAINATINENGAYSYVLPATDKNGISVISMAATHSAASTITTDVNGNHIYEYAPAQGYTGVDVVVITTHGVEAHTGCFGGGNQGGCNHGGNHHDNDDQTVVTTINFSITPASASASKITISSKIVDY